MASVSFRPIDRNISYEKEAYINLFLNEIAFHHKARKGKNIHRLGLISAFFEAKKCKFIFI